MIKVIAQFNLKAGNAEKAKMLCADLVKATREEKGCIQYDLLQDKNDENIMVILENWASQEDLDEHYLSDHFLDIVPKLADLCVELPKVNMFEQII